ncbi:hypothetical protein P43SY_008476 [Pythium insidiosum]|uniref:RNase H type-1 domain-containing protein n=1 Tax=Pythium insidiosum TaxID=114742 RepID=A0AAD5MC01_PYTIN|nr:hypothetical protein P43SY_008476 [Pythium insidiosum]
MSTPASTAEPKPSSAEDAASRKSSKKAKKASTKKAGDASVPASASPGPSVPTAASSNVPSRSAGPTPTSSGESAGPPPIVPRIPLAEPKTDSREATAGTTDRTAAKARSSKKRTSNDDSGPTVAAAAVVAGPSLAPVSNDGPAPKSDVDAEKERARREAKRQKAKELEEQRRREELERQALEDARRLEEQRLREERRKRELAALNANAEDVQEEEPSGYDDEGFENYDDDFENDEPPAQSKPSAKATPRSKASPQVAEPPVELKKIQQALQAESKELSSSRPSSSSSTAAVAKSTPTRSSEAKSTKTTSSSSIASSIVGLKQSLDPRARRVKDILDARKLEIEKFNLFQQPPLSETEKYMSQLRRGHVRQTFIQTNEGAKVMSTQTKPPRMVDKAMHFPDDIGVDDGGIGVRRSRRNGAKVKVEKSNQDGEDGDDDETTGGDDIDGGYDDDDSQQTSSSSHFFRFLEQASTVRLWRQCLQTHPDEDRASPDADYYTTIQAWTLRLRSALGGVEPALGAQNPTETRLDAIIIRLLLALTNGDGPPPAFPAQRTGYVLFFDGGSRGNPGPGGSGSVIVQLGHTPAIVWAAGMSYAAPTTTNNHAEYLGLCTGLSAAEQYGYGPLEVVGDSHMIIQQMTRRRRPKNPRLHSLYEAARSTADAINVRGWRHHYRTFNKMADKAANQAMDSRTSYQTTREHGRPELESLQAWLGNDLNHWLENGPPDLRSTGRAFNGPRQPGTRPDRP